MKNILWISLFCFQFLNVQGQDTLVMPQTGNGGIFNTCFATIYDNGGITNYLDNSHSTITIYPLWVQTVSIYFEEFQTEVFFDSLTIYDGPGITFPVIGSYSGTALQGQTIHSTGNSITLEFHADDIETFSGFKAWVSCIMGDELIENIQPLVYPNPTRDKIQMKNIDLSLIKQIKILDVFGQVVYDRPVSPDIDIHHFVPGIYTIQFEFTNGKYHTQKLIKQ